MANSVGSVDLHSRKKSDNASLSILFIFLATALQSCFGFARNAPPVFKFAIAFLCWLSIVYACLGVKRLKRYPKLYRMVLVLLALDVIVSFFHSLLFGVAYEGNKYIVLMTNMYGALNVATFVFLFSVRDFRHLERIMKLTFWLFAVNALLLLFNYRRSVSAYFLSYFMVYSALFFPYIDKKKMLYFAAGTFMAVLAFFGGGRQVALSLLAMVGAWIGPKFVSKRAVFYVSLAFLVLPVVFIWFFGGGSGEVFDYLGTMVSDQGEEMSDNTRTFLYVEFLSDFMNRDIFTQLFGQGPLAHYESAFFAMSHRFGIEVPVLEWIMQCGLVYYVLLTLGCAMAIRYLYKYGRNKMCQIASLLIGGFFLMAHVSNFAGCSTINLGFWMMMSMAVNPIFLKASDRQIKVFFSGRMRKKKSHTGRETSKAVI